MGLLGAGTIATPDWAAPSGRCPASVRAMKCNKDWCTNGPDAPWLPPLQFFSFDQIAPRYYI